MNAAVLFTLFPLAISALVLCIRKYATLQRIIGISTLLILAIIAWTLPLDEPIRLGFPGLPMLKFQPYFRIDVFVIRYDNISRAWIALVYSGMAIVSLLAALGSAPASLNAYACFAGAMLSLIIGSDSFPNKVLGMTLFSFSGVFLWKAPNQEAYKGIERFLFFQIFGISFLLLSYTLPGMINLTGEENYLWSAQSFFFGLGILMMSASFPFHSWLPLLLEQRHSLTITLTTYMHVTAVILFGGHLLSTELQSTFNPAFVHEVRLFGAISALCGGLFALGQETPSKALGYGMVHQVGMSLLALVHGATQTAIQTNPMSLVSLAFTQGLGVFLWALTIHFTEATLESTAGAPRFSAPLFRMTQTLAILSMAGFPLLANFPIYLGIWEDLFYASPIWAAISLAGSALLASAALRMESLEKTEQQTTMLHQRLSLALGMALVCLIGLLPQHLLASWTRLFSFMGTSLP